VNTGIVDVLCVPMIAAKSTVAYLKQIMPGQSEAWYERIANDITAGKMPLPKVEGIPAPTAINPMQQRALDSLTDSRPGQFPSTGQWEPPITSTPDPQIDNPHTVEPTEPKQSLSINPARQRFLDSLTQSESSTQEHFPSTGQWKPGKPKPETKPKSKTQQLKQGVYRAKAAVVDSTIPETVDEALKRCPKRPTVEPKPKQRTIPPASEVTKYKLYRLAKDWNTAFRLVEKLQFAYPDRSEQWCWEKAIYDLERDRHV
jgi:hypothetical protein